MGIDDGSASRRTLGVGGLLSIAFFWVCGGIYGNETLLEAAPPGYVFLMLILTPVFYATPVALITGELATALPYDGGLVAWVYETCGPIYGAHNTFWLWTSYMFDAAVYPVLAAEYIGNRANLNVLGKGVSSCDWVRGGVDFDDDYYGELDCETETGKRVVAQLIIVGVTAIKLAGTDWVVRSQAVLFVGSLLPTAIFVIYGSKDFKTDTWTTTDTDANGNGVDLALLLSWGLWLYSGFFSLGALAGEVKNPSRTFPLVIVIMMPLVATLNIWPLAVSVSIDDDRANYKAGHFDKLATELAGEWLGISFVIGAFFCNVGLYNAQVVVCERSLAASTSTEIDRLLRTSTWRVTKYLLTENGTGVAPIFIIFHASIALALIWLPYQVLVESAILQMTLPSIGCMYAFLYYKVFKPDLARPFAIPGKVFGAVLMVIPVLAVTLGNMYISITDEDEVVGIKHGKAWSFTFITFGGLFAHGAFVVTVKLLKKHSLCGFTPAYDDMGEAQSLIPGAPLSSSDNYSTL